MLTQAGQRWTGDRAPTDRAPSVIEVDGVWKRYGASEGRMRNALKNINLLVQEREFVSLIGPSGCGKTTLLRILGGLIAPSSGSVRLKGEPVTHPRPDIGFVFQTPVLLPWRTTFQNVMLPAEVLHLDHQHCAARAMELLELVGLKDWAQHYPSELSGGMQQRAAIVRSLITDPAVLLMDEPFGALDAMTREAMNLETLRIWAETKSTVIFVTHSIPEAVFLSDRVVVLCAHPGRVIDVYQVELPRPRDLDIMNEPEFGKAVAHLRRIFQAQGTLD